jgi:hypothetical protein
VGVGSSFERLPPPAPNNWQQLEGWSILFGHDGSGAMMARASIANAMQRLPAMLGGLC